MRAMKGDRSDRMKPFIYEAPPEPPTMAFVMAGSGPLL